MKISEDHSSFGELLKYFRKRQGFTQQQLATAIEVHRNAISRWEGEAFLPENKRVVLQIAKQLQLDDQEARQLLEASLTAPVPPWNVPYQRNPFFTGHQETLDALDQYLNSNQAMTGSQSCALQGLGGIGKTQLAVEYAYRHALEYSAVLWINAESTEKVLASFSAIAELLQLPGHQETDQQRTVYAVQHWLTTHSKWLLIWDALEDIELLQRYLPSTPRGTHLITTRRQALGTLARGLDLPTLKQEDATLLLLRRAKILSPEAIYEQMYEFARRLPAEYATAETLVTMMGGLPLALDQIGSYIEETGCSLLGCLHLYEQQCQQLLNQRGRLATDHPQSVMRTLSLAYEHIASADPIAAELLCLCAFLHPDAIPEELLEIAVPHLKPTLQPVDSYQLNQAIATLRTYSLINRRTDTHTLSVHRLVQVVLKEQMDHFTRQQWIERTVHIVNRAFSCESETRACQLYLAHIECCAHLIDRWKLVIPEADQLLQRVEAYQQKQARHMRAERLLSLARAIHH